MNRPLPSSCAVCTRLIFGKPRFEPLGRNDALVAVCPRCATEEVPEPVEVGSRSPETIKARARQLANEAAGLCIYAKSHGRATHGKTCHACVTAAAERSRRRRRVA